MDTSSSVEPQTASGSECPICRGMGFAHPLMPSGEPDISEVYPCRCSERYQPAGTDEIGDILSIFWNEGKQQ